MSALYVGRVRHLRLRPKRHALSYRVFWMLLDLDEIDTLAQRIRLFSRNRFNLYAFHDADYGDRSGVSLRRQVDATLASAGIAWDRGAVRLLTMPRILGYAFNPISVYFCHARDGSLGAIIYEVHNTFGEIHSYVASVDAEDEAIHQEVGKSFHVSPFLDLDMRYSFRVAAPNERVSISIEGHDSDGSLIAASLYGARKEITNGALLRLLVTHPLLTLKVTAAIHWHALQLLAKRVPFFNRPPPPKASTTLARAARGNLGDRF